MGRVAVCAAALLLPAHAVAQATTVVVPTVSVGAVYDDNVTWQPKGKLDHVWRVSPAIDIARDTALDQWRLNAEFGAEWFDRYRELSTAAASQHLASRFLRRSGPTTSVAFDAGYDSGLNPSDININTGLTLGRVRATRWFAGPEVVRGVTERLALVAAYRITGEFAATTTDIVTHAGEFGLQERFGERDKVEARYISEFFQFLDRSSGVSHRGFVRLTHRVAPGFDVVAAGGARFFDGSIRPNVDVSLTRRRTTTRMTASYAWDQVTALGVTKLVDVHRAQGTIESDQPHTWGGALSAGFFRNAYGDERADVYRAGAEVRRSLGGPVWVGITYSLDYQRGRIGVPVASPLLLAPLDATPILVPPTSTSLPAIRRNSVMVRVFVTGRVQSASGPTEITDDPTRLPLRGGDR